MRDPERIERITNLVKEIWSEIPDWRFAQLISNFHMIGDKDDTIDFYREDDEVEKWLDNILRRLRQ